MVRKCAITAALALVLALAPAAAKADWLFTPSIGAAFSGSVPEGEPLTYGASISWMGAGVFGWEADIAYTQDFFGDNGLGQVLSDNNVTTLMGSLVLGIPFGGREGAGIRPYGVAGVGLLQTRLDSPEDLFNATRNSWGSNLGGGVMAFVSDHFGFRGDIRYFRGFSEIDDIVELGEFRVDYWRGTGGVTFRW